MVGKLLFSAILFFSLTSHSQEDEDPCRSSGMAVYFEKGTNKIYEMECDSIDHVYRELSKDTLNYAILAIYSDKEDPRNQAMAVRRGEIVKVALIERGISMRRLKVFPEYQKPPQEGAPLDWPFLPADYSYELGVYFNGNY